MDSTGVPDCIQVTKDAAQVCLQFVSKDNRAFCVQTLFARFIFLKSISQNMIENKTIFL